MLKQKSSFGFSHPYLLVAGILLIAANMRAPIIGVAPLFGMIRETFALTATEVGALTTLPLLAFALVSPFCVLLAREYGLERSLFIALVAMAVGVAVRPLGPAWTVFVGSAIIGVGIAIANVLLPALVKRDFPDRITALTSAYALTMNAATALASAVVVPIATLPSSGWERALGVFIILPVSALIVWAPQLVDRSRATPETATPPHGGRIWHSPLAWQVAFFFGLNSLISYTITTWLPAILTDADYSPAAAGSLHGVTQLATAAPSLVLAPLIHRLTDQRGLAVVAALVSAASLIGLMVAPQLALAWAVVFGLGSGSAFILALSFVSLRAGNVRQAGALSGMAQTVGYTLAAATPPVFGLVHDLSGNWSIPLSLCVAACIAMAAFGYRAGRSTQID